MACILKSPSGDGKGVVVFTTPERDQVIRRDRSVSQAIARLKERWVVGLHHNWHDHAFVYDALFDFSMAGEGDLLTADCTDVPLITLDACNFVPSDFQPGGTKFWDVLYVARAVTFKGLPQFLDCVRALYDADESLRVLCVCPIPPERPGDGTVVDLEQQYVDRFSADERRRFTLWALRHDYPFPLDLSTLAHLYRSSRAFVHFAPDERRCRVAGYAWSAGLPVVAMAPVGSLLPTDLRHPPHFYEAPTYDAFPRQIRRALTDLERDEPRDTDSVRRHFVAASTTRELRRQLHERFPDAGFAAPDGWFVDDLDIRLGRHHGISVGANDVGASISQLIEAMGSDPFPLNSARSIADPEIALAHQTSEAPQPASSTWLASVLRRR
jgi:hypothetical protein